MHICNLEEVLIPINQDMLLAQNHIIKKCTNIITSQKYPIMIPFYP